MAVPFGTLTVTLYHKTEKGWTRHTLHGCSWRTSVARQLYDSTERMGTDVCSCRWSAGQCAAVGDVLVLGAVQDTLTSGVQIAGILEKYSGKAFVCESFHDNTHSGQPLPHYCARGRAYGC